MNREYISVSMIRPTLDGLPSFDLPQSYRLRGYRPGDEAAWVAIHVDADPYHHFDAAVFAKEFSTDQTLLTERQMYLCPMGEDGSEGPPIGTATAWFGVEEARRSEGLVHWVAIHPSYQGRGLAKPLLAATCHRLCVLGHQRAYLNTSTVRIPAINLYLSFGFIPAMRHDTAITQRAWEQVAAQLDHPAIAQFLAALRTQTP
ncbi:MAG TPA: GNAT family N-acetyltransferase [Caldilineaceae bacterium]|nr:GNAT family N-acetyltransferase [Caldilineaceae bacterium]